MEAQPSAFILFTCSLVLFSPATWEHSGLTYALDVIFLRAGD